MTSILFEADIIDKAVRHTAHSLIYHVGKKFTVVVVLKAAWVFAADLLRHLPSDVEVEFVSVSTYEEERQAVRPPLVQPLFALSKLDGKSVVVLDTVFDTGATMRAVRSLLSPHCSFLRTCALVWKIKPYERPALSAGPDIFHWRVQTTNFLMGYGLDDKQRCRGQRSITALSSTAMATESETLDGE